MPSMIAIIAALVMVGCGPLLLVTAICSKDNDVFSQPADRTIGVMTGICLFLAGFIICLIVASIHFDGYAERFNANDSFYQNEAIEVLTIFPRNPMKNLVIVKKDNGDIKLIEFSKDIAISTGWLKYLGKDKPDPSKFAPIPEKPQAEQPPQPPAK